MTLQEIFDQLTYGELSQLSLGGGEAGRIDESNYVRIIPHINLGLLTLYRRFLLKEGRVTLALQPGQTTYQIHSDFAVSSRRSRETVRYLLDSTTNPFEDDVLKLLHVYTSSETGDTYEIPLNDRSNWYSVFTPSSLVLRVPEEIVNNPAGLPDQLNTSNLTLVYQAKHALISTTTGYAPNVEIELPYSHLEALLLFVASRLHNPIGMTNEFHAGNSYAAKFEQACRQLEIDNANIDQGSQNDRIYRGGWA